MADDKNRESDTSGPALYYLLLFLPLILGLFWFFLHQYRKSDSVIKKKISSSQESSQAL